MDECGWLMLCVRVMLWTWREKSTLNVCDNNKSWLQQHAVDELENTPEEILHNTAVDVRGVDGALWPEAMEWPSREWPE